MHKNNLAHIRQFIGLLISPYPDQEGNKHGSMSETHARFPQHRDASCHQVFFSCKARRRRKFTLFRLKHWLVSFLAGLRIYQHPCIVPHQQTYRYGSHIMNTMQLLVNCNKNFKKIYFSIYGNIR